MYNSILIALLACTWKEGHGNSMYINEILPEEKKTSKLLKNWVPRENAQFKLQTDIRPVKKK